MIDYVAPIPPVGDLPTNRANWALERDRAAVLVHDLQEYFLRPYATGCPALRTALDATSQILAAARANDVPVFYTAQQGDQDQQRRGLQKDLWGPGMSARPEHTQIIADVAPADGDVVLTKHRYSAFYHSDLADRLAAAGRSQLVITGVYAHIGVTATAMDAFQREIHPFVVADAVADFGAAEHLRALEQIGNCCGVVSLARDVVSALNGAGDAADDAIEHALDRVVPPQVLSAAHADPDADIFALGLNSLQAFEMLDDLADIGVDIDFSDFVRNPTLSFLRSYAKDSADRG